MQNKDLEITSLLDKSFSTRSSDLLSSINFAKEAIELCKENHDTLKAKALSHLSLYHMVIGKYEDSYNYSQRSLQLYEKLNDEIGIAEGKYIVAGFYYKTDNIDLGFVHMVDALLIFKKHSDYFNISRCEKVLGCIYDFVGDEKKALQAFNNAIKAAKEIEDKGLEANANINLSGIYLKKGEFEIAKEIIDHTINVKQNSNDLRGLGFAIYGRAKIFLNQKRYNEAEADFQEAISIHNKTSDYFGLGLAYNKLSKLYFEKDDFETAKKFIQLGLEICTQYNILIIKIKLNYLLYLIYKSEKNTVGTLAQLELYIALREQLFNIENIKIIQNYDLLLKMQTMQKESEQQQKKTIKIVKENKIAQQNSVRQEFLSTMSHEIRTPLNAVTTIARMLSENPKMKDKTLIDSLNFSSNHLMQIINDILDYTKLDLGKMSLYLHTINIKVFLNNFYNTYSIQAKEKGIDFKIKIDSKINDYYTLDETKLTQILGNLVSNAIKFTDVGSAKLKIEFIESNDDYDTILFKISDSGIGIDNENLDSIFESFSQIKNGLTRKKDGAGLGLSITKKLVELYGSEIKIESVYGTGSTFSFELKLKKSVNIEKNNHINFKNDILGLKVLLVEDNSINAMIALKLLSNWGIISDLAKNGLEATEKSKLTKYDFILMDIHMPVLDGYQAAKNIRTLDNLNKETPIIGLTADVSANDNNKYSSYFNEFLYKPLEIEKLKLILKL